MKKIFFIACFSAIALLSCNVRDESKKKALEKSTTVQLIDSVYNFGTINQGEKVEFNFRFKNTGNAPLVITDAAASCGCTVPEKPERPILPGETGFIKVVFNSAGKRGHSDKTITVHSNAKPEFPELMMSGEIKAE